MGMQASQGGAWKEFLSNDKQYWNGEILGDGSWFNARRIPQSLQVLLSQARHSDLFCSFTLNQTLCSMAYNTVHHTYFRDCLSTSLTTGMQHPLPFAHLLPPTKYKHMHCSLTLD